MPRTVSRLRFICGTVLAFALYPVGVIAQTYVIHKVDPAGPKGYQDLHISRAAVAGQQVRIWAGTLLNPDCTPSGTITTQVVDPPRHGELTINDEPFYPNYIAPNPRAICDTHKSPGKQAFYTPEASFHGHEKIVFQAATSEGRIRRVIVDVDVR